MLMGHIVFSNESCFQLCPDDHRRRVWRHLVQRVDPAFTTAHHTGPQPGFMIWGAISFDSRTPLVIIRGTLTAKRYFDDILSTVLLQYSALFFSKIMPDHIRQVFLCTILHLVKHFLGQPDLSPIQHVWDMMGR
ncbi:transposable element Tc1 transposase [Trichonephila clavipes]|nr:transposable element Tc1 transposase [Trichonephila clavipes]